MTRNRARILIVDDDVEICALVVSHLQHASFDTVIAHDGAAMTARLKKGDIDAIVLDLNLPDADGLEICQAVRAQGDTPIIILTARGDPVDRIVGLELGADDYLAKPFEPRELVARIKSVLRRATGISATPPQDAGHFAFEGWSLSVDHRALIDPGGKMIALSGAEYRLLRIFLDHPGETLSREVLLKFGAGAFGAAQDRAVDLQVSRLRSKLRYKGSATDIIKTVRQAGYCFDADVASS